MKKTPGQMSGCFFVISRYYLRYSSSISIIAGLYFR